MKADEQIISVSLGRSSYEIYIGHENLTCLQNRVKLIADRGVVISNPTVLALYEDKLSQCLAEAQIEHKILSVPEGEEHKSLKQAARLYDELIAYGMQRSDFIVALGGGVIGDLSGFVAATYMRGVPFIQVPTTLLAQVDSSVGGKVAVNHKAGKNLIGCFYQPKLVQIDVGTLGTLPMRELRAGFAEVIKCGFLLGEDFLSFLEEHLDSIMRLDTALLIQVVSKCCSFKARVVEEDEKDFGKRAVLNYGHTIGHAIEAASKYESVLHGEAIAIGMVGAAIISEEMGWVGSSFVSRHIELFKRAGLPFRLRDIDEKDILRHMALDKKGMQGITRFILLKGPGRPVVHEMSPQLIKKALSRLY